MKFETLYSEPSRNGLTRPKGTRGDGVKMVNMGELFANERIGDIQMERVPVSELELERFGLLPSDLLFARQSLIASGAGQCALVSAVPEPTVFESHLIRVRLNELLAAPGFYYYFFRSPHGVGRMQALVKQVAAAGIRGSELQRVLVPSPPLPIQKRIVSILSAYDDLIEINNERIRILEEVVHGLYHEWFVCFRFPGHEVAEFCDSSAGSIPVGWDVMALGDMVEDRRDGVSPEDLHPDTPYFGLEHLPRRCITLGEWGSAREVSSVKLRASVGDILFGKIRPYFHKVGVCPIECVCSADTIVLRPRLRKWASLAVCVTSSDAFVQHATKTSGGTKMPRADWKVLKKYLVPVGPEALVQRFNGVVDPVVVTLRTLTFQNRNLRQTRDLLLPRLISGELDVSTLPLPEAP